MREQRNSRKIIDVICEHSHTSQINVVLVDKDMTEISVLESKIQDAHIQVCTCSLHVLKSLNTKLSNLDLNSDQKSELVQLLHEIVYPHEEQVHTEIYKNAFHISGLAVEKSG